MIVLNAATRSPNGISAIMMMSTIQIMVSSPLLCVMVYVLVVLRAKKIAPDRDDRGRR